MRLIRQLLKPRGCRALVTYLNEHLAGAQVAAQLLESMRSQIDDQEFRQCVSALLPDIGAIINPSSEKSGPSASGQLHNSICGKLIRRLDGESCALQFRFHAQL